MSGESASIGGHYCLLLDDTGMNLVLNFDSL